MKFSSHYVLLVNQNLPVKILRNSSFCLSPLGSGGVHFLGNSREGLDSTVPKRGSNAPDPYVTRVLFSKSTEDKMRRKCRDFDLRDLSLEWGENLMSLLEVF